MSDYYQILGVNRDSSQQEIKRAYRKIAMKYHPDKNPGDPSAEEKFKEASEAYSVLSNSQKKAKYDQFGHEQYQNMGGGFSHQGEMSFEDIFSSFGDIFGGGFGSNIFSSSSGRGTQSGGATNLKISLVLTLEEMYSGTTKTVKVKRLERTGEKPSTCLKCNGSGEIRMVQKSFLGQIVNVRPCSNCNGIGYSGGTERRASSVDVTIPKGVSSENKMSVRDEGNQSALNMGDGSLIVYFEEKEHKLYTRVNDDIYLDCYISYYQAVVGDTIEVPALSGQIKLKIPAGISSGQILRLKDKGMPIINSSRYGDFYIKVIIDTPKNLSSENKVLLKKIDTQIGSEVQYKKYSK